jgi:hypothetical protein
MSEPLALDIGSTWQTTVDKSVNIGTRLVAFLIILVIGWFIARLLAKLADRLLDRLRVNAAAERSGLRKWTGKYRASELIAKLVYYAVLLFTLELAFNVFGPNPVSNMLSGIVNWLPKAFVAVIIIVVAAAVAKAVYDIAHNALGQLSYGRFVARAAQVIIIALGLIAALNQIEVATSVTMPVLIAALATIGGIAVVGLGGGLIAPMRQRWERALGRVETESIKVSGQLRARPGNPFSQPAYRSRTDQSRNVRGGTARITPEPAQTAEQTFPGGIRPATPD